jgi:hypothetical protein
MDAPPPTREHIVRALCMAANEGILTAAQRLAPTTNEVLSAYWTLLYQSVAVAREHGADMDVLRAAVRALWHEVGGTDATLRTH